MRDIQTQLFLDELISLCAKYSLHPSGENSRPITDYVGCSVKDTEGVRVIQMHDEKRDSYMVRIDALLKFDREANA